MRGNEASSDEQLAAAADAVHEQLSKAHRDLLSVIAELDRRGSWRNTGARDTAHWLSMRYGISRWKAHRWIAAAHALEELPHVSDALARGDLGIDKVVELTRFAAAETEENLIVWAKRVSCVIVRRRGDLAARASRQELVDAQRSRFVSWWYLDEGRRFGLEAELPAAQGAIVASAIERMAPTVPVMPEEADASFGEARRADALVAICSARIAADPNPDRATVVVHAEVGSVGSGAGGGEIEDGPALHPTTVERLLCNARTQTIVEDPARGAIGVGRMRREPPAWLVRQVRYRDRGCRFPGCGTHRFAEAHHVVWWRHGGRTDLDNLLLICSFHHRLVHELGWSVRLEVDGSAEWFHPDGKRYEAGPSPGNEVEATG